MCLKNKLIELNFDPGFGISCFVIQINHEFIFDDFDESLFWKEKSYRFLMKGEMKVV